VAIERMDMTDRVADAGGGGPAAWGSITGVLANQLDLLAALNAKEPVIATGAAGQYWRGDKTWQTLDKTAVGLGSVDNTSDVNKPVSTATALALAGKAASAHGHISADVSDFSEAVDDRVGALLVAGVNVTLTYNDAGNQLTIAAAGGAGGSVLSGAATITMDSDPFNDTEVVAAVGVTAGKRVFLSLGEHLDTDENDPELLDLSSLSGVAGLDQITVKSVFMTPTSGPVKLNWMAV
jgi:hypothetical protein